MDCVSCEVFTDCDFCESKGTTHIDRDCKFKCKFLNKCMAKHNLEKVLDYVIKEEDRYYDLAGKCFDENNMQGNMINQLQGGSFQRVRYYIEVLMQNQNNGKGE
jgi:hypothetical protein